MKYLKQYRIPFSGLNAGKHSFDFDIEKKFFDCFEHSIVKDGNLKAQVDLQKQENMLIVHFTITGTIKLTCDICLSEFDSPIDVKERVLVKFTDENWEEDTEEVIVLSKNDYEFDIAHLLYEYINVAVPYYTKCSEQGLNQSCDPEMLAKVNQIEDEEENSAEEHIDPRWSALRNIKNN
ncbi:YceD family protein [Sphingobacterium spiritivorum]|uniref:YceD family protein n=1 Tax=Sphingobacterium spiritivorum TaxID=258 RepID=UPI00191AFDC9|nr:DUF177 domain-containing protein [Sphingobacterium spiritivorum]QQT26946.1 DUF177 domain-containing protein [Sphingobacterium spiritivorum]